MGRWKLLAYTCLAVALGSYAGSSAFAARDARARCPMRFLAVRHLAHGTLPHGETFTITGERYRFQCHSYFSLATSINRPGTPPGGGGGASFNPSQSHGVLAFTFMTANTCPHTYAVAFGLLRAPSDVVLVRRGNRRVVLQHAPIPAILHARGVLVYARLADAPNEVIVQRRDGKRLLDQRFHFSQRCLPG